VQTKELERDARGETNALLLLALLSSCATFAQEKPEESRSNESSIQISHRCGKPCLQNSGVSTYSLYSLMTSLEKQTNRAAWNTKEQSEANSLFTNGGAATYARSESGRVISKSMTSIGSMLTNAPVERGNETLLE
jgi:hypothetical protein